MDGFHQLSYRLSPRHISSNFLEKHKEMEITCERTFLNPIEWLLHHYSIE